MLTRINGYIERRALPDTPKLTRGSSAEGSKGWWPRRRLDSGVSGCAVMVMRVHSIIDTGQERGVAEGWKTKAGAAFPGRPLRAAAFSQSAQSANTAARVSADAAWSPQFDTGRRKTRVHSAPDALPDIVALREPRLRLRSKERLFGLRSGEERKNTKRYGRFDARAGGLVRELGIRLL